MRTQCPHLWTLLCTHLSLRYSSGQFRILHSCGVLTYLLCLCGAPLVPVPALPSASLTAWLTSDSAGSAARVPRRCSALSMLSQTNANRERRLILSARLNSLRSSEEWPVYLDTLERGASRAVLVDQRSSRDRLVSTPLSISATASGFARVLIENTDPFCGPCAVAMTQAPLHSRTADRDSHLGAGPDARGWIAVTVIHSVIGWAAIHSETRVADDAARTTTGVVATIQPAI